MSKHFLKKLIRAFLCLWISLIFCLPVHAEIDENGYDSCFDEYKIGTYSFSDKSNYWKFVYPKIYVEPNKTYYIRIFSNPSFTASRSTLFSSSAYAYDTDKKAIGDIYFINSSYENYIYTFTTPNISNLSYLYLSIYTYENNYEVLKGTPMVISDNLDNITSCPVVEEPDTPSFEDANLSNFFSIYTTKLTEINNFALNNNFFMGFVAIIILFIVLELFLYLFNLKMKGRR